ncbi:uncharacterized protein N0V89_009702 [Didymosphaeria variabile]|uniref:Mediator of RNA polymerase II transcription subunit 11 n=1 Tax=Didymosphaeria variabile TaxID=1932322 RepID=A0A9W9C7I4_9PLEO|nr:uncharacterized protein N0V89_009702 [Didymosphaeria variabile]KAJ4348328.1 hypothetical protein N0V89_009702 [Didymosphaeria variabile]
MAAEKEDYRSAASTHIRALSTLSSRVPPILNHAATTLSQLTNAPISSSTTADSSQARRNAISSSAKEYFTAVFDIAKDLHKQVSDLEEAGVIPAEEVRYIARTVREEDTAFGGQGGVLAKTGMPQTMPKDSEVTITNGGLGEFDIGVLNARAGIRESGEGEVLEKVKRLLEDLDGRTKEDSKESGEKMDET